MKTSQSYNEFNHDDLCLAIDLGTTNSVASVVIVKPNGDIICKVVEIPRPIDMFTSYTGELMLSKERKATLPSCVYYRQERSYEPIVGDFAKRQYPLRPHLVAKSIKSQMGNPLVKGLAEDIPDKTPAEISAKILKHIVSCVSKMYGGKYITDAVITVPANFDSAMCKATRDAAELAGIKIRNEDGSERPILLSEPNAVIYDLINQIQNGEIPEKIVDLSQKKTVLVFDLGGGTLDITMHEISRRKDAPETLKVKEIATNRYTLLGGDDFDEAIAKAMFSRYQKRWASDPRAMSKIKSEANAVMAKLRSFAENLKIELNERYLDGADYVSAWDDEGEISIDVGGNMQGSGYSYEDVFKKSEVESILSEFMAEKLCFDDYKKIDDISDTKNIIYPILDVLNKASAKLGTDRVNVDYVVVNGGMSKFYMVTERLKKFFGFDPIVALDPDQAVARGAAVYHHYLHKYKLLAEDMKNLGTNEEAPATSTYTEDRKQRSSLSENDSELPKQIVPPVKWETNILNDALFLGLKNGQVHELIPTGAELPYMSEPMKGFKMEPGQKFISLPIKTKNLDGKTYRKISSGNITFQNKRSAGCFVSFRVLMGTNKVITMQAWTSSDEDGMNVIDHGIVDIAIDNVENTATPGARIIAPSGARLDARSEINSLIQFCANYENTKIQRTQSQIAKKIAFASNTICKASNSEDFAEPILEKIQFGSGAEARQRMFTIARKLGNSWNPSQKNRLANACLAQIRPEFLNCLRKGAETSVSIQAVYTLSMCGTKEQLESLRALHEKTKFLQACLYVHSKTKTELPWIYEKFMRDADDICKSRKGSAGTLQLTAHAIGAALRKDGTNDATLSATDLKKLVQALCNVITEGDLTFEELVSCLLALGWICDCRQGDCRVSKSQLSTVLTLINNLETFWDESFIERCSRTRSIVRKMIEGQTLNNEDEQYLLEKLDI